MSPTETKQLERFVGAWNQELRRVGPMTARAVGEGKRAAAKLWQEEVRARHPWVYTNKDIVVGHLPDMGWGGNARSIFSMPLLKSVNSYIGGLRSGVPVGTTYDVVQFLSS